MLNTEALFTIRKWTVKEYHKLADMRFFYPEERVELLSGNIITISAKGTATALPDVMRYSSSN